jgi:three-Cys-motif partner protein
VPLEYDVIGPWTEVKLDILGEYASPYSKILIANGFYHLYIDAFAAGGAHLSRTTGDVVLGSALRALSTEPPFREYHFIDANLTRVDRLRESTSGRADVHVHAGDCNEILIRDVFRVPGTRTGDGRCACLTRTISISLGISSRLRGR